MNSYLDGNKKRRKKQDKIDFRVKQGRIKVLLIESEKDNRQYEEKMDTVHGGSFVYSGSIGWMWKEKMLEHRKTMQ